MKDEKKNKPRTIFKVGDKILDFGHVCQIYKVSQRKDSAGKRKRVIHFRHFFKTSKNRGADYLIPIENIKKANIRKPISKKELKILIKKLLKKPKGGNSITPAQAKDNLNKNDIFKTAQVLKKLWLDKNDESTSFPKAKKDLLDLALRRLVEEVALVGNLSISESRKKIKKSLKRLKK